MWRLLYNLLILPPLWLLLRLMAFFNRKVRAGFIGRKSVFEGLSEFRSKNVSENRIWMHVSSMGEFEQAKPIIEGLKRRFPGICVVVSFFSPSGLENSRRYPHADYLTYMPFDSSKNARRFLEILDPTIAVFIRYDVWPNHIWACKRRRIPVALVNATMRASSPRLLPVSRPFHRALFNAFDFILTISDEDAESFKLFGLSGPLLEAAGDTRFDRVRGRAEEAKNRSLLPERMVAGKRILVAGSSWNEDEEVLLPALFALLRYDPDLLCVIVPHEPTLEHLESLEYRLRGRAASLRFSYLNEWDGERILLVDSIGILLPLYASADVAFVGGGFRSNVHNTLEPAAYGIPVLYGPKLHNSREAAELAGHGGGFIVRNRRELYRTARRLLSDAGARAEAGAKSAGFIAARTGATDRILSGLPFTRKNAPSASSL